MKRRTFLEVISAGAAGVLTGGLQKLVAAIPEASTTKSGETFLLGGDLLVNRLGFGAMRLTGEGIWGWPPDRENAKKVLRRAVELGVNFIDTADAYGPETDELLIAEALYPYPKGLVIATKGGNTRPGPEQWVPDGRPEYLSQCVDKSLKRLKLERIDLYQLHRIDRQGAGRRIVGRAENGAGCRKNSARWIIGSDGGGNRTGEKGLADCQHPEPIQHHRPRLGGRAQLLRERKDGIHSVGADWRQWKPFVDARPAMRWKPKRNVITSAWCNSRSPGCCKNRRSCCRSRAHRRLRISRRTWLRRNFSSVRTSGRGSKS